MIMKFLAVFLVVSFCLFWRSEGILPMQQLSITTSTIFEIETSTTFPYCMLGAYNSNFCKRRRRKKRSDDKILSDLEDTKQSSPLNLESTLEEGGRLSVPEREGILRQKLLTMVRWSTVSVTEPVTVVFTDPATTIPISIVCIPAGGALPPAC